METAIKDIKGDGRITNAYIIAFVLILTSYLASIYTNKQLVKQAREVAHTHEVITNLETLTSTIKDAETGTRGYFITKNIDFLAPYYGTRERTDSLYRELSRQMTGKDAQQERLQRLHSFINERMGILEFSITEFKKQSDNAVRYVVQAATCCVAADERHPQYFPPDAVGGKKVITGTG
jgi:CHASE3 domain sensor protein